MRARRLHLAQVLLACACLLAASGIVSSATIWEMGPIDADPAQPLVRGFRYTVEADKVRLEQFVVADQPPALSLTLSGSQYVFDPQSRLFQVTDPKFQQRLAVQMYRADKLQQAQIAAYPPDIQAWMKSASRPQRPRNEVRATGRVETVQQYQCSLYEVWVEADRVIDYCTVPFASVPGGAALQASIQAAQERRTPPAIAAGYDIVGAASLPDWAPAREVLGLPIRVRRYDRHDGSLQSTMRLHSLRVSAVPPSTFSVPSGYRQQKLPEIRVPSTITPPTAAEIASLRRQMQLERQRQTPR